MREYTADEPGLTAVQLEKLPHPGRTMPANVAEQNFQLRRDLPDDTVAVRPTPATPGCGAVQIAARVNENAPVRI